MSNIDIMMAVSVGLLVTAIMLDLILTKIERKRKK